MKALTIRQPWASLIAEGIKTVETRSWATKYRGPLAIHAGARKPSRYWSRDHGVTYIGGSGAPWHDALERYCEWTEYDRDWTSYEWVSPLGAVVATCELIDVVPVERIKWNGAFFNSASSDPSVSSYWPDPHNDDLLVNPAQQPYGDFAPGRFAWLLTNIVKCDPIPAKGKQGLWNEGAAPVGGEKE